MYQLKHSEFEDFIFNCYDSTDGRGNSRPIAVFVMGGVGIGKTDGVRSAAKKLAQKNGLEFSDCEDTKDTFYYWEFNPAGFDSVDLIGIPFKDENNPKCIQWRYPNFWPENGAGMICIDEYNTASDQSVINSLNSLLLSRRLNNYIVPNGVSVVATGNRPKDFVDQIPIPAPSRNRFVWCELTPPSAEYWIDNWAVKNDVDYRIISFIQANPDMLYMGDNDWDWNSLQTHAFPTPRSWGEQASSLIRNVPETKEAVKYVAASVGEATAHQFQAFLELQHQIPFDEIMADPTNDSLIPRPSDRRYALVTRMVSELKNSLNKTKGKKSFEMFKTELEVSTRLPVEFGILYLKSAHTLNSSWFRKHIVETSFFGRDDFKDFYKFMGISAK